MSPSILSGFFRPDFLHLLSPGWLFWHRITDNNIIDNLELLYMSFGIGFLTTSSVLSDLLRVFHMIQKLYAFYCEKSFIIIFVLSPTSNIAKLTRVLIIVKIAAEKQLKSV